LFLARYFRRLKKRAAISGYMRRLPKLLAAEYGKSDSYTPAQVRRTIERNRLNAEYSCYGMAMFCHENDFNDYHHAAGEACSFAGMRSEIAHAHFHGDANFSMADITGHFSGGDSGGHGHGDSGHGGGDFGGGGHH
jgi:uncharacterized membrane protein YgcG